MIQVQGSLHTRVGLLVRLQVAYRAYLLALRMRAHLPPESSSFLFFLFCRLMC